MKLMNETQNTVCKAHSGFKSEIDNMKNDIRKLWEKWDTMQKTIIAIFVTLSLNLIGVIFLLLRG